MINGKFRETSLFLYNLKTEPTSQLYLQLQKKVADFFLWYSQFNHKKPVETFEIYTSDVSCTNHCPVPLTIKISALERLLDPNQCYRILNEEAQKHHIAVKLKEL
jgi:hypothetical protein